MSQESSVEGANSLTKNALDHCIFPITHRDDLQQYGPLIVNSGVGVHITDIHGRTYLDMMSSMSRANSLGYGNEEIARAMYEQAKKVHYVGTGSFVTEPMVRLAERLAELAPGRLSKTMFVSGGSEAVETAFKIAKQYQQASGYKPNAYKIISRWNAFHGATMGALSATDWLPIRETIDPRVPGYSFVGNPLTYRNPFGMAVAEYEEFCATHLERQIQLENPALVAAFIGEPIMQANGAQVPSKHYWQRVREICTKYGVLMIVDEIITGFGRAGHWFASEHFGIEPDIMTSAKALTAGYIPMGAVITRDEIADAMPIFRHVHTFSGHAVAAAAANAVIDIKTRDNLIPRSLQNGEYLQEGLRANIGDHPIVGEIRGMGSWHAVEFTSDRATKAAFEDDTVKKIARRMLDLGIIVNAIGRSIELAPPLIVTRTDLDRTVDTFKTAIDDVANARRLH
jgi:putrescine---pyruvate transaminase